MPVTDYCVSGEATWYHGTGDQFVGVQGRLITSATRTDVAQMMGRGGTFSKLRIRVVSSSGSGAAVVTLIKNGTATSLAISVPANTSSDTLEEDDTTVSFDSGDELCWRIELPSATNGPSSTTLQWIAVELGDS